MNRLGILVLAITLVGPGLTAQVERGTSGRSGDAGRAWNMEPDESYRAAFDLLSKGKQSDAEALLEVAVRRHPENQDLVFFMAVLSRSRWAKGRADGQFGYASGLNKETTKGKAGYRMMLIDLGKNVDKHCQALAEIADQNPEDAILQWLTAIALRQLAKDNGPNEKEWAEKSAVYYERFGKMVEVGPSLFHQSYANVLSEELGRHEDALPHRLKTVELEPKGWSYQGLGNTYRLLKRHEEAENAFAKCVEMDPYDALYWYCRAINLHAWGKYPEALRAYARSSEIDPYSYGESCAEKSFECCVQTKDAKGAVDAYAHNLKYVAALDHAPHAFEWSKKFMDSAIGNDVMVEVFNRLKNAGAEDRAKYGVLADRLADRVKKVPASVEIIKQLATNGNAHAVFWLSRRFVGYDSRMAGSQAEQLEKGRREQAEWQKLGAELGSPECMYQLAMNYETGSAGFQKDRTNAIKWYLASAGHGYEHAITRLAWVYAVSKDSSPEQIKEAPFLAKKGFDLSNNCVCNKHEQVVAAAYARNGDFENAVKWQKAALDKAAAYKIPDSGECASRLNLYERGQPYVEESDDVKGLAPSNQAPSNHTGIYHRDK